jgi:hypothetical protein
MMEWLKLTTNATTATVDLKMELFFVQEQLVMTHALSNQWEEIGVTIPELTG